MDDLGMLAVLTALEKVIKRETDGKEFGSLRERVNQEMMDDYERDSIVTKAIKINGKTVGKLHVIEKKIPAISSHWALECEDKQATFSWRDGTFQEYVNKWLQEHIDLIAEDYFDETGEIPKGCKEVLVEGLPAETKTYTMLKGVKPEGISQALGAELPGVVAGLLEG